MERDLVERDDMIEFISSRFQEEAGLGGCRSKVELVVTTTDSRVVVDEEVVVMYQHHTQHLNNGFGYYTSCRVKK